MTLGRLGELSSRSWTVQWGWDSDATLGCGMIGEEVARVCSARPVKKRMERVSTPTSMNTQAAPISDQESSEEYGSESEGKSLELREEAGESACALHSHSHIRLALQTLRAD